MEGLTIREAAALLAVNHKVIRRLINEGVLTAEKTHGPHGLEWRVDPESAQSVRDASTPRRGAVPVRAERTPLSAQDDDEARDLGGLRADKRFLQQQVQELTAMLRQQVSGETSVSSDAPQTPSSNVTEALQAALRFVGVETVASLEFASMRLLWGRPVLWRTVTRDPAEVAGLVAAILDVDAEWEPPGAEVAYVFALDADGETLWATACGPGWFGPKFGALLLQAHVERK